MTWLSFNDLCNYIYTNLSLSKSATVSCLLSSSLEPKYHIYETYFQTAPLKIRFSSLNNNGMGVISTGNGSVAFEKADYDILLVMASLGKNLGDDNYQCCLSFILMLRRD
jgi:hypothetical protein